MDTEDDIRWRDERIAELEQALQQRDERLERLEMSLHERDEQLAQANERIEELEQALDKLQRYIGLDSNNSSRPPSSDDDKARSRRKRRKNKKGNKQGGQPGHKGHKRDLWPEERVHEFVHHYPSQCDCGLELSSEDATGDYGRHQVFELPPEMIICTEHRLHTSQCPGCGRCSRAQLAPGDRLGWGPRLVGLVATMDAACHDSRRQLNWFVKRVLGAPSSTGSVDNALMEASDALAAGYNQARHKVEQAQHIGCDETGWRKGRLPYWIWVAQCQEAAVYVIREGRGKQEALEVLQNCRATTVMTDQLGSYHWLGEQRNQICRAHLLRKWKGLAQRDGPLGEHGQRLVELERQLHRAHRSYREGKLSWSDFVAKARLLRECIEWRCQQASVLPGAPGVVKTVLEEGKRERCWLFLEHEGMELTNNQSERDLRMCVIRRKLSWGSKSEAGLRLMERLWTVAQTCKRQGKSLLDYITRAITAHRSGDLPPLLVQ